MKLNPPVASIIHSPYFGPGEPSRHYFAAHWGESHELSRFDTFTEPFLLSPEVPRLIQAELLRFLGEMRRRQSVACQASSPTEFPQSDYRIEIEVQAHGDRCHAELGRSRVNRNLCTLEEVDRLLARINRLLQAARRPASVPELNIASVHGRN